MQTNGLYYKECLGEEIAKRCEKNPHYSMRSFAKACGLSPGELSQILSEKRIPSYKVAQKILAGLDLTPSEETKFLSSVAERHQTRGLKKISKVFKGMTAIPTPLNIDIDLFRVIGDWYHYAVLMLTEVTGFKNSPRWIASQIGISEMEASLAVERLIKVGLLEEKNGSLVFTNGHITTQSKHLTTPALKRHTKQSLEKAIYSLENDPIEERSHTYMTMAIDPKKINEAKLLIEEFTNRMSGLLEVTPKTRVYEFGVYLYPLQKKNTENL